MTFTFSISFSNLGLFSGIRLQFFGKVSSCSVISQLLLTFPHFFQSPRSLTNRTRSLLQLPYKQICFYFARKKRHSLTVSWPCWAPRCKLWPVIPVWRSEGPGQSRTRSRCLNIDIIIKEETSSKFNKIMIRFTGPLLTSEPSDWSGTWHIMLNVYIVKVDRFLMVGCSFSFSLTSGLL